MDRSVKYRGGLRGSKLEFRKENWRYFEGKEKRGLSERFGEMEEENIFELPIQVSYKSKTDFSLVVLREIEHKIFLKGTVSRSDLAA